MQHCCVNINNGDKKIIYMDKQRFSKACEIVFEIENALSSIEYAQRSIGTYKEKTLHAVMKHYFEGIVNPFLDNFLSNKMRIYT